MTYKPFASWGVVLAGRQAHPETACPEMTEPRADLAGTLDSPNPDDRC